MRWRKRPLDPEVHARLTLLPKERIIAWVDDGAGRLIVASESALHLQRVPPGYARIGWEQIEQATYEAGVLSVTLTPDLESATLRVPVGDNRELPIAVRDRVTASIVVDRFVPLEGEAGVRIVGRRAADGSVTWRTDLDGELEERAAVGEAAKAVLAEVRADVGDL